MELSNRVVSPIAFLLLGAMFVTAVLSMRADSLTFDELAHITAGYSYLKKQDYRLNPEHPPLAKDIAALPLLFLSPNFPDNSKNWLQQDSAPPWWVQFDLGSEFIYKSGNNPREIIFLSRLAMIFLLVFCGWLLFWWTKKITNSFVALGVLTLFAFSPTLLAHGRLANTDVGAAFGTLLAIIFWLKFLDSPSWKNVLSAGISFGAAMLLKFSLILLIPFFIIITFLYAILFSQNIIKYSAKALAAGLLGFILVVWPVYQFHIWNYPAEQQIRDTAADISGHPVPWAKDIAIWMAQKDELRAPAQYLRGILMATQRTAWGNTAYFFGEISAEAWPYYFPLLYLLKIPLAFHILTLLAVSFFLVRLLKKRLEGLLGLLKQYFWVLALFLWLAVYWSSAILGNLNIGVRHLLPVFPFTYILLVFAIYQGIKALNHEGLRRVIMFFVVLLFGWYAGSSLFAFPHYISYYNELAGGTKQGYKIAVDSNYDWGQDFYRLLEFVEKENLDKIYVDYFGGENAEYWLGEKYVKLNPREIKEPPKGWLAVSANHLMGGLAQPSAGFNQETGYYNWLKEYKPVARAGYSIFIYHIE